MVTAANGYFMNEIQNKIESLGYYMTCSILNSKNYGVPQSRERAFILAYRHKTLSLPFPETDTPITVRQAISDLSYLNSGEGSFISEYKINTKVITNIILERIVMHCIIISRQTIQK